MNLAGKDFLKLLDYTSEEIEYLIDLAADLKEKKKKGEVTDEGYLVKITMVFNSFWEEV